MRIRYLSWQFAMLLGVLLAILPPAFGQSTGTIEFVARAMPTGARPEPVRQFTFVLLRKSLADTRSEVAETDPAPDMPKYIDGLSVSPELKSWMKKNQTVQLGGANFNKSLTPSDVVDIPEFFKIYLSHATDFAGLGFPKPKFKEKDRTANPEKYEQEKEEYKDAVAKFIAAVPESAQGIDAELNDINPYPKWTEMLTLQKERVEKRALLLAQTRDMVAQTDTNLDGQGGFAGLAPGDYWVGNLDRPGVAGDARLYWDVHVTVHVGEATRVELNNLNASPR